MNILDEISDSLQSGNANGVIDLVNQAIEKNFSCEEVLNDGLIAGMSVVGVKFKDGEIFIPEVLISARAMTKGIEILEPLLLKSGVEPKGKIVMGTVKDDLHDIGKNLVSIMFRGSGFEVVDLGVNVCADKFLEAAKEHSPDAIGLSALLTTTMVNMEGIIKTLKDNGVTSKIIIGGAPVTQNFADSINADLFAHNAVEGVDKILQMLSG